MNPMIYSTRENRTDRAFQTERFGKVIGYEVAIEGQFFNRQLFFAGDLICSLCNLVEIGVPDVQYVRKSNRVVVIMLKGPEIMLTSDNLHLHATAHPHSYQRHVEPSLHTN